MGEVLGKGVNGWVKGFGVFVGEFVVGLKGVFGFVFGEDVGELFEVGMEFVEEGFVFVGNDGREELENFLRGLDVGLEVGEVGVGVRVLFGGDFGGR
ncbi:hypothetical protein, partial [Neisseria sicca]|uniref:hypothetical protein n=1 Tax=Neisseria sicca TaxID=490 RepID=UPI0011BCF804